MPLPRCRSQSRYSSCVAWNSRVFPGCSNTFRFLCCSRGSRRASCDRSASCPPQVEGLPVPKMKTATCGTQVAADPAPVEEGQAPDFDCSVGLLGSGSVSSRSGRLGGSLLGMLRGLHDLLGRSLGLGRGGSAGSSRSGSCVVGSESGSSGKSGEQRSDDGLGHVHSPQRFGCEPDVFPCSMWSS